MLSYQKYSCKVTLLQYAFDVVDSNFSLPEPMAPIPTERIATSVNIERSNIFMGDVNGNVSITYHENPQLVNVFTELRDRVSQLPEYLQDNVFQTLTWIEEENKKGDTADQNKLKNWVEFLLANAPDIAEVAIATFVNPVLGASVILQKVAAKAKENRSAK